MKGSGTYSNGGAVSLRASVELRYLETFPTGCLRQAQFNCKPQIIVHVVQIKGFCLFSLAFVRLLHTANLGRFTSSQWLAPSGWRFRGRRGAARLRGTTSVLAGTPRPAFARHHREMLLGLVYVDGLRFRSAATLFPNVSGSSFSRLILHSWRDLDLGIGV